MSLLAGCFKGKTNYEKLHSHKRHALFLIGNLILWISAHPTGEKKHMLLYQQNEEGTEYSRQSLHALKMLHRNYPANQFQWQISCIHCAFTGHKEEKKLRFMFSDFFFDPVLVSSL